MQAIANIGWKCGRCGFALLVQDSTPAKEFREISCLNHDCGNKGIRYREPELVVDLQHAEEMPNLVRAVS